MRDPFTGNNGVPIIMNMFFSIRKRPSVLFPKIVPSNILKMLGQKEMFIPE